MLRLAGESVLRLLCITLLAVLAQPSPAVAASSAAVFGSFSNQARAIALSENLSIQFNVATEVVEAEVGSQRFFRVMSYPQPESATKTIIQIAKQNGFPDVWLVNTTPRIITATTNVSAELPATAETAAPEPDERPATRLKTQPTQGSQGTQQAPLNLVPDSDYIARVDDPQITIDGFVDEAAWEQIQVIDQFTVLNPDTLEPSRHKTQTLLVQNKHLTLLKINYNP